jgi:GNAT superfamily N-acetyltransferase
MENIDANSVSIRPMTPDDYTSFVALHNLVYPIRTRTIEEVIKSERKRDPKIAAGRRAAFIGSKMVGFSGYAQWSGETHKTWFQVNVVVHESYRRRGIGTALYSHLSEEFTQLDPKVLRADAYENLPSGMPFAGSLEFKDVFQEGPSHLELESFDELAFEPLLEGLEKQGVRFLSYKAFMAEQTNFADALYASYCAAWTDVPKEEESEITRADWQAWVIDSSDLDYETSMIALADDRIAGFCEIGTASKGRPVYAGLAGVSTSERGRGIATALYARAIDAIRSKGHPQIQTSSGIENLPMQTVYGKLGFVREPVWIQLERRLP